MSNETVQGEIIDTVDIPSQPATEVPVKYCATPSPINGVIPPAPLFQKGKVANPKGRPAAGATLADYLNSFAHQDLSKLRKIVKGTKNSVCKIAAARLWLRAAESEPGETWRDAHSAVTELLNRLLGKSVNRVQMAVAVQHVQEDKPPIDLSAHFPPGYIFHNISTDAIIRRFRAACGLPGDHPNADDPQPILPNAAVDREMADASERLRYLVSTEVPDEHRAKIRALIREVCDLANAGGKFCADYANQRKPLPSLPAPTNIEPTKTF